MSSALLKKFGKRVRDLRVERGLSQEKLGELAKVHRTYVGMIERRRRDSNPRGRLDPASLAVRCFRPLSHVSMFIPT